MTIHAPYEPITEIPEGEHVTVSVRTIDDTYKKVYGFFSSRDAAFGFEVRYDISQNAENGFHTPGFMTYVYTPIITLGWAK